MRVLITGSNGQLGSEIKEISKQYTKLDFFLRIYLSWIFAICKHYKHFIIDNNINAVINCAAYTAVDKAEEDADIAEKVNSKEF